MTLHSKNEALKEVHHLKNVSLDLAVFPSNTQKASRITPRTHSNANATGATLRLSY